LPSGLLVRPGVFRRHQHSKASVASLSGSMFRPSGLIALASIDVPRKYFLWLRHSGTFVNPEDSIRAYLRDERSTTMSDKLSQLFANTQSALAAHPEQATATFAVESRGHGGLFRKVKVRGFSIDVDEPAALGGTDRAPNPVEYALAALATCQEITYWLHAAALGIPLNDVSVKLEGAIDLRGFFAAAPGVRPGFGNVRGTVQFDSPAKPEDLRRLKQVVDAHCPVLDLFRNPTPVTLELAETAAVARAA
jgi:putative redox protein